MTRLSSAGRLLLALCALASTGALAQGVPAVLSFTGNLSNSGAPVSGNHNFVFTLYDRATAGSSAWTETQNAVPVTNGLVFASLGAVTPFTGLILNGAPLWLEVSVDGTVLSPRLAIQSVPYAVRAGVANACEALGALAPGDVVNVTANQTIAGTKTFSSPIVASITGNAATATTAVNFSGALAGDVTGTQGATKVGRLQGVTVSPSAPAAGNLLAYNGVTAAWTPTAPPPQAGIKSSGRTAGVPFTGTTLLQSLSVTFPADGQALITGQCQFRGTAGASIFLFCNVTEATGDGSSLSFDWDNGDQDNYTDLTETIMWHKAVTAGLKKYNLSCLSSNGVQEEAYYCQVIAQYFPTLLP